MKEYMTLDSGGYLCTNIPYTLITCGWVHSRSWDEVWLYKSASKVESALSSPEDWILN